MSKQQKLAVLLIFSWCVCVFEMSLIVTGSVLTLGIIASGAVLLSACVYVACKDFDRQAREGIG